MDDNLLSKLVIIVGIVFSAVVLAVAWFAIVLDKGKRELAETIRRFDAERCEDGCDEWLEPVR